MQYFNICNAVFAELNLTQLTSFSQFSTTRMGQEVLRHVANINYNLTREIFFEYRIRQGTITVPAGVTSITNPFATVGEIKIEKGGIIDATNQQVYNYNSRNEDFVLGTADDTEYGLIGTNLLFSSWAIDRTLTVYYYTWSSAKDINGNDILYLTNGTDTPIMPDSIQTYALVDGTCLEIKKRTDNSRLPYWKEHFTYAKNELRSFTQNQDSQCKFQIAPYDACYVHNITNSGVWGY